MIRTVGIVSLSSGILGEPFVQHEVRLGLARLQDYGLQVRFLPHARAGIGVPARVDVPAQKIEFLWTARMAG